MARWWTGFLTGFSYGCVVLLPVVLYILAALWGPR